MLLAPRGNVLENLLGGLRQDAWFGQLDGRHGESRQVMHPSVFLMWRNNRELRTYEDCYSGRRTRIAVMLSGPPASFAASATNQITMPNLE